MSFETLPVELETKIFGFLPDVLKKAVCTEVCKKWYDYFYDIQIEEVETIDLMTLPLEIIKTTWLYKYKGYRNSYNTVIEVEGSETNACHFLSVFAGRLDVLESLRYLPSIGKDLMNLSLFRGHFEIMKWLCEQDKTLSPNIARAIIGSSLEMTMWIAKKLGTKANVVVELSIEHGRADILDFVLCHSHTDRSKLCAFAARAGQLRILKTLRSLKSPCPWDEDVCTIAAHHGYFDLLKWAIENGCPWGAETVKKLRKYNAMVAYKSEDLDLMFSGKERAERRKMRDELIEWLESRK